jgi:hypothetical protein
MYNDQIRRVITKHASRLCDDLRRIPNCEAWELVLELRSATEIGYYFIDPANKRPAWLDSTLGLKKIMEQERIIDFGTPDFTDEEAENMIWFEYW